MAKLFKVGGGKPKGEIRSDWNAKIRLGPYRFKRVRLCTDKATSERWAGVLQAAVDRQQGGEPPDRKALRDLPPPSLTTAERFYHRSLPSVKERSIMNQQFVSTHQVESGFQGNPSVFTRIPPDFQKRIFFLANATDQIRLGIADREIYLFLAGKLRNTRGAKVGWQSWWTLPISIAEIVEGTGYHRCTVSKSLAKLARLGFIDCKDHALRCKRVYYIYAWNAQYQRYKAEGKAEAPVTAGQGLSTMWLDYPQDGR